ncbi:MAG: alpha/beta hydrolase [Bdellovibrionales bacterium]|nr:alpha/beta hydrolase [Oligoflexia bacterium]
MFSKFKIVLSRVLLPLILISCSGHGPVKVSDFQIDRNITYKVVDGKRLGGDLYRPRLTGPVPVIVVVHGGSWSSRGGLMTEVAEDLARSGFAVFNVVYRLAPESLYPKAVEDVRDAVQFMETHSAEYGLDSTRVGLWGYSAGAHLALMVGLDPVNGVKSIVAGGTPADFLAWPHSPIIKKFIGFSLQEKPEIWKEASPINHVRSNSPPVFMYHGDQDDLVEIEQMNKMAEALELKQVPVETHIVKGLGHISVYLFSEESLVRGIRFLQSRLAYHP